MNEIDKQLEGPQPALPGPHPPETPSLAGWHLSALAVDRQRIYHVRFFGMRRLRHPRWLGVSNCAYDYYNPDRRAEQAPVEVVVTE